ncbi:MAG: hypothetical protein ACXAC7_12315 [Candidatus Hodarchaeales archaeon]|jgi:hypothetical protein
MKYKIIKTKHGYRVLGRIRKIKGHFWWRKIVKKWVSVNSRGTELSPYIARAHFDQDSLSKPHTPCRTKEAAKELIKSFKGKSNKR